jgi:glycosyltransferase involved in cell wall biosynthesis
VSRHIVFCLPGICSEPTGGTKVVFEYANRLRARGHRVTLVLPAVSLQDDSAWHRALRRGQFALGRLAGGPRRWFPLRDDISLLHVPDLSAEHLPDADVVVATFWKTAEWVARYPQTKGRKLYLIQHYETWAGPAPRVDATWRLPMTKVVPAHWLTATASRLGVSAQHIPNGLDTVEFGLDSPVERRDPRRVMMLFNPLPFKGSGDAIAAMAALRTSEPQLTVAVFGVGRRPALPNGFHYVRQPSRTELRALYNSCAIYLAPSHTEGWDLPATEAMLCGCALAASDVDGHHEYAVHGHNALLFPAGDLPAITASVKRLITDDALRLRLATSGLATARAYSWDRAVDSFSSLLNLQLPDAGCPTARSTRDRAGDICQSSSPGLSP